MPPETQQTTLRTTGSGQPTRSNQQHYETLWNLLFADYEMTRTAKFEWGRMASIEDPPVSGLKQHDGVRTAPDATRGDAEDLDPIGV